MIVKFSSGRTPKKAADYDLNHDKAKILYWDGLDIRPSDVAMLTELANDPSRQKEYKEFSDLLSSRIEDSFNAQASMNPRVTVPVRNYFMSYALEDGDIPDEDLIRNAKEHMEALGIVNTQFMIVRHYKPDGRTHVHVFYNVVDCNGKKLDEKFLYRRNIQVCREITRKYNYSWGQAREKVPTENLKGNELLKAQFRNDVFDALHASKDFDQFTKNLQKAGITPLIRLNSETAEPEGISYLRDGHRFSGSSLHKGLSYNHVEETLERQQNFSESQAFNLGDLIPEGNMGKSQERDPDYDDEGDLRKRKKKGVRM